MNVYQDGQGKPIYNSCKKDGFLYRFFPKLRRSITLGSNEPNHVCVHGRLCIESIKQGMPNRTLWYENLRFSYTRVKDISALHQIEGFSFLKTNHRSFLIRGKKDFLSTKGDEVYPADHLKSGRFSHTFDNPSTSENQKRIELSLRKIIVESILVYPAICNHW